MSGLLDWKTEERVVLLVLMEYTGKRFKKKPVLVFGHVDLT